VSITDGETIIMNASAGTDVCRVTVIGPRRQVEIALPAHVPLADLFPALAGYAGIDRAAAVQAPGGWVLQRLGQLPFEPQLSAAQAGLADGELIYLRPAAAGLPPAVSDDIADAIAGVHGKPDRWTAADARRAGLGAGLLFLLAGAVAIARAGPPWTVPAEAAAVMAVVLVCAAAVASRAAGDAGAGIVLGCAALPYAFLAGLAGSARLAPLPHAGLFGLLAGFAAVMVTAIVAAVGVAAGLPVFSGVAAAAAAGVAAAWMNYTVHGITGAGAAAAVVTLALVLTPLVPGLAFRLARVQLPPVPATVADLRDDAGGMPDAEMAVRAESADRFVTGAACALGLLGTGAEITLGLGGGLLATVTAVVLSGVLLLRSRLFRGLLQRLWLMIPGYGGLAWLAVLATRQALPAGHLALVLATLLTGTGIVAGTGCWLPRGRPSPFWGRAADVAEMLTVVSMIPLAMGVAGIFGRLHGLGG
jgi:type VII secretion integral membrane protein EccD